MQPKETCQATDFFRSFVTDTAARDGAEANNCRAQVQACCTLVNQRTGQTYSYALCQGCLGEHMYKPGQITQVPTALVTIIISTAGDRYMLLKQHADHASDVTQIAGMWDPVKLQDGGQACRTNVKISILRKTASALPRVQDIIDAMMNEVILVGRTTISNADESWKAILEYPIGYINCLPRIHMITVDVGPIVAPDFSELRGEDPIACLRPSFILYKSLDHAEIVHRVPTPVGNVETLHYSKILHYPAVTEIVAVE